MDLEAIIKAPTKDPDWIKKCLLIGLMMLIPIAGALNLLGWMKETYRRAKAGETNLPEANLSYIGGGWSLFLAILPVALIPMIFGVGFVGLAVARMHRMIPLLQAVYLPVSLFLNVVVVPTLVYRHVVHGSGFGGAFDFAAIKATWMTNVSNFVTFAILYFAASLIGGMGVIACCIGMFVTVPFSLAIHANLIKGFEEVSKGV